MLDSLRNLIADLTGGQTHPGRFEENDYRLAAAALLIHASDIDGKMSGAERSMARRWPNTKRSTSIISQACSTVRSTKQAVSALSR